jgi:hypothetical protein
MEERDDGDGVRLDPKISRMLGSPYSGTTRSLSLRVSRLATKSRAA